MPWLYGPEVENCSLKEEILAKVDQLLLVDGASQFGYEYRLLGFSFGRLRLEICFMGLQKSGIHDTLLSQQEKILVFTEIKLS